MANFEEIDEARRLLELPPSATLQEIKQAYRRLAFRHHPDRGEPGCEETMKRLNFAYRLLIDYCASYRYTFNEEDVARAYPGEQCTRRYAEGWFDGP